MNSREPLSFPVPHGSGAIVISSGSMKIYDADCDPDMAGKQSPFGLSRQHANPD